MKCWLYLKQMKVLNISKKEGRGEFCGVHTGADKCNNVAEYCIDLDFNDLLSIEVTVCGICLNKLNELEESFNV